MADRKHNPWDVLAWIAFGIVVIYFILKAAGVIQSPFSVDLVAIISASYFIGRRFMKLDYVYKDAERLKVDVAEIRTSLDKYVVEGHK